MCQTGNDKPLAIGLELPQGRWVLEADGTLHFFGGKVLAGGAFSGLRGKVRRIVIDDFVLLGDHLFENFNRCEEVVLSQAHVLLGSQTFAHCHQLRRVIHAEGLHGCEDAFLDTPYGAVQKGEIWVPPEQRHSWIGGSPEGRRFLDSLRDEIETMRTLPDPKHRYKWSDFAYDDRDWFSECLRVLRDGGLKGEPTLMYLFARCIQGMFEIDGSANLPGGVYELLCPGMEQGAYDKVVEEGDDIVRELYLKAADAGSPHAALWVAYGLDGGRRPFSRDPGLSEAYARRAQGKLDTLELEELAFLKQAFLDLVEEACDADIQEDIIGDEHGFRPGEYEHLVPNPGWRTLHLRYIELAYFMLRMGLPYVPQRRGFDYQWPSDYEDKAAEVISTAEAWETWCVETGYIG